MTVCFVDSYQIDARNNILYIIGRVKQVLERYL